jgi:hypothetical protein
MGGKHVRERLSVPSFVDVHAITDWRTVLHRIDEDADDGA